MSHQKRYDKTLKFLLHSISQNNSILDIGTPNAFTEILKAEGFKVHNTKGEDLDEIPEILTGFDTDVAIALEILEHLINPLSVLKSIKANRLFASVPLQLWFARAYRNKTNRWDQHFHEFEDWQFDWLLEKAGWEVVRREKWTFPTFSPGIRPLLRSITPRYYIVEATRK